MQKDRATFEAELARAEASVITDGVSLRKRENLLATAILFGSNAAVAVGVMLTLGGAVTGWDVTHGVLIGVGSLTLGASGTALAWWWMANSARRGPVKAIRAHEAGSRPAWTLLDEQLKATALKHAQGVLDERELETALVLAKSSEGTLDELVAMVRALEA